MISIDGVIIALLVINLVALLFVGTLWNRLTKLEARVDNLPTHRDLVDLRGDLQDVRDTVSTISGQMTTTVQMLRTIQEHLLENDR